MILAMRRQAPMLLAVAIVGVSYVSFAQVVISNVPAPKMVTFDEVRVFVYTTLAMVLLAVCGSAAGLVAFVLNRDRASASAAAAAVAKAVDADHKVREEQFAVIGKAVGAVGAAVAQLVEALKRHDESPFAHSAASHANHDPMLKRLDQMAADLSGLIAEHRVIRADEDSICAMLRKRDPLVSPRPRRSDDSVDFDGRPLRGHP